MFEGISRTKKPYVRVWIPSSYYKISSGIQGKIHFEYSVQLEYFKCASLKTLEFSMRIPRVFRALYRNTLGLSSPYSTSIAHLSMLQNSAYSKCTSRMACALNTLRLNGVEIASSMLVYLLGYIYSMKLKISAKWVWRLKFTMFPQFFSPWVGWTNHLFIGDGTIYRNLSLWNPTVYALRTCICYGQKRIVQTYQRYSKWSVSFICLWTANIRTKQKGVQLNEKIRAALSGVRVLVERKACSWQGCGGDRRHENTLVLMCNI